MCLSVRFHCLTVHSWFCHSWPQHIHRLRHLDEVTRHEDHLCLLCRTVSAVKHLLVHFQICFPVTGDLFWHGWITEMLPLRIQFVMKSAARLVFSSSRYKHITPLLHQLHCLKATERIDYKLAVLVYKCREGIAPSYLPDELCQPAHSEARCHLCSASLSSLIVHRKQLSTVGNCSFLVAASCIWNVLPQHVMSAPSVSK